MRGSVRELEEQGWRAFWFPEVGGREAFTQAGLPLAATEWLRVVNGIAQIWSHPAHSAHGAAALLADAYPGRHLLGLGFGGEPHPGVKPRTAMRDYLDELDSRKPAAPIRRILAAYGPKMLELARDRAFLAVEHAVLFETDPAAARTVAREHLHTYLTTPYNIGKFRRLGYTEDDLARGGSDRIVDDLVFWGDLETITGKLRRHLEAGADHVAMQVIDIGPGATARRFWRELGEALLR